MLGVPGRPGRAPPTSLVVVRSERMERVTAEHVAALAHRLRNHLNIVGGGAALLADAVDGDDREIAHDVQDAAIAITDDIERLIILARDELNEVAEPEAVDLAALIERVRRRCESRGHALTVEIDAGDGRSDWIARAVPAVLERVMLDRVITSSAHRLRVQEGAPGTAVISADGPADADVQNPLSDSERELVSAVAHTAAAWLRSDSSIELSLT